MRLCHVTASQKRMENHFFLLLFFDNTDLKGDWRGEGRGEVKIVCALYKGEKGCGRFSLPLSVASFSVSLEVLWVVNAKGLLLHSSSLTDVCRSQKPCLHRLLFFFLFLLFLGFNATLSVHVPSFVTYKAQKPKSDSPKLRRQPPTSLSVISYYLRYCVFPTEPGEEVIIKRIIMGQVSAFSSSSPSLVIVLSLLLILFISEGKRPAFPCFWLWVLLAF